MTVKSGLVGRFELTLKLCNTFSNLEGFYLKHEYECKLIYYHVWLNSFDKINLLWGFPFWIPLNHFSKAFVIIYHIIITDMEIICKNLLNVKRNNPPQNMHLPEFFLISCIAFSFFFFCSKLSCAVNPFVNWVDIGRKSQALRNCFFPLTLKS